MADIDGQELQLETVTLSVPEQFPSVFVITALMGTGAEDTGVNTPVVELMLPAEVGLTDQVPGQLDVLPDCEYVSGEEPAQIDVLPETTIFGQATQELLTPLSTSM